MNNAANPVENQQVPMANEDEIIFSNTIHKNAFFRDYAHFKTVLNEYNTQYRHFLSIAYSSRLKDENQELVNTMRFRAAGFQCGKVGHTDKCRRGCYIRLHLKYRSDLKALQISKIDSNHPIDTSCHEDVEVYRCPCRKARRNRAIVAKDILTIRR